MIANIISDVLVILEVCSDATKMNADDTTECIVGEGKITFFYKKEKNQAEAEEQVADLLNGQAETIASEIEGLDAIEFYIIPKEEETKELKGLASASASPKSGVPSVAWIVPTVVVASCLLIAAGVFIMFNRRREYGGVGTADSSSTIQYIARGSTKQLCQDDGSRGSESDESKSQLSAVTASSGEEVEVFYAL